MIFLMPVALGLFLVLVFGLVPWITHFEMTRDHSESYGWASYNRFKKEFPKYEWERRILFPNSYADRVRDCEFHASIIKFNDIGMVMMTPIDYFLAQRFVKKYFKKGNYKW